MFMGWTGLLVTRSGGSLALALACGAVAGVLAAWLAWRLLRSLLRLQSSGTLELPNVIGQTGTVHLHVPARQSGAGKIMVEVQGALREMDAVSEGEAIPTGTPILVVGLNDQDVPVVHPFYPPS
jgi:membrane protein implicated in regulation of membrane protease activity